MPRDRQVAPPIRPLTRDALTYEAQLRRELLNPLHQRVQRRIADSRRTYFAIRQAIAAIPADPQLASMAAAAAQRHMDEVKAYHTDKFRKQMLRFLGVDILPMALPDGMRTYMQQAIRTNVDLIKTIEPRYLGKLRVDLEHLMETRPFDEAAVKDVLRDGYKSSGYNLRRLARDQTSKAVGQFNLHRQVQVGIEEYLWSTALDERVRPSHRIKNDVTYRWDSPPPDTGHPGEDVQCRCVGLAIIPPWRMRVQ